MTITGAINRVDGIKPNGFRLDEKVRWLSVLDGRVHKELYERYLNPVQREFGGYDEKTSLTRELLVPYPYDEMYVRFLEAQIDYANGEYEKYNNSITLFNAAWSAFEKYFRRAHKPETKGFIRF